MNSELHSNIVLDPNSDPEFWNQRIGAVTVVGNCLRESITKNSIEFWERIDSQAKEVLGKLLKDGDRVLDAGCGLGDLYPLVPKGVRYVGFDMVTQYVMEARRRFPGGTFLVFNVSPGKGVSKVESLMSSFGPFDWVICRGKVGPDPHNLLRFAPKVLEMSFENPSYYEIHQQS